MILDNSKFPIVFIDFEHSHIEKDGHEYDDDELEPMTHLLGREQPFVMINTGETPEKDHKHSKMEIKRINAWMKVHKSALKEYAKATIHIEASKVKRMGLSFFTSVYEKFWKHPLLLAESKERAIEMAEKILNEVTVGSPTVNKLYIETSKDI